MGTLANEQKKQENDRQNEKKWTATLMKAGWTAIPSVILERQQALGLDAVDINIIAHIARHWWFADNLPFPSKKSIAECMGIHPSTVQRRIAAMERADLIKRVVRSNPRFGQQTNSYDLSGLIREATPFAQEAIADREQQRKANAERRTRKRPRLKVL